MSCTLGGKGDKIRAHRAREYGAPNRAKILKGLYILEENKLGLSCAKLRKHFCQLPLAWNFALAAAAYSASCGLIWKLG